MSSASSQHESESHTITPENSIFLKEFDSITELGHGAYGYVYKARRHSVQKEYAVKIVPIESIEQRTRVKQEAFVLANLEHNNIVRYFTNWVEILNPSDWSKIRGEQEDTLKASGQTSTESTEDDFILFRSDAISQLPLPKFDEMCLKITEAEPDDRNTTTLGTGSTSSDWSEKTNLFLFIEMELCHKTLKDYIKELNEKNIPRENMKKQISSVMIQITVAIKYFHGQGVIHRDLKPDNIFVVTMGSNLPIIKIGDFGVAYLMRFHQANSLANQTYGSSFYSAPELKTGSLYDSKVDVYSTGVIFFELFYPFGTDMERHKILTEIQDNKKFPTDFTKIFGEEEKQIQMMLKSNPSERQTSKQLHIWTKCYRARFK